MANVCRQSATKNIHVATSRALMSSSRSASSVAVETNSSSSKSAAHIDLEDRYGAHNYHPLPVVIAKGEGETDVGNMDGR